LVGSLTDARVESLFWTIVYRFESLAARQYAACVPELLTPEKRLFLDRAAPLALDGPEAFAGTPLGEPVTALIASAQTNDPRRVLVVQGFFLELLGRTLYRTFGASAASGAETRAVCELGEAAADAGLTVLPTLLAARIGAGEILLQAFMDESQATLASLDSLGEGIDEVFRERYGMSFADLMGDVAAEAIAMCVELGMDRRKFVSFLTGALMGI
jgi:hypothetical protein